MNILQALFFPPEQPGGVSSMIPYILDRFQAPHWEMELFSLPKRIRGKGSEEITFRVSYEAGISRYSGYYDDSFQL